MGYLKYVKELWKKKPAEFVNLQKSRAIGYRREPVTIRIERPTRIDRARALGYKAKTGFIVVRQKVNRGGRKHSDIKGGRRSASSGEKKVVSKNYQQIAEEKANKKYVNCEVLGSYFLASDGKNAWYEIIFADRHNPNAFMTKNTSWIRDTKGKVYRGLTSSGRKGRGLRKKGMGSERTRPSKKANKR